MAIIQKRADELKPGDVIAWHTPLHYHIVCAIDPSRVMGADRISLRLFSLFHGGSVDSFTVRTDDIVEVQLPDLTPAQQHAEELVDLLTRAGNWAAKAVPPGQTPPAWAQEVSDLLLVIKPPEPPTLAEALALLADGVSHAGANYKAGTFTERAEALLDRARRAGMLK